MIVKVSSTYRLSKFDCLIFEMLFINLRDTACKYFLAFNSTLFYSLRIWFFFVYIYIQTTFLIHFDLKMTLSERRNVVAFLSFLIVF